MNQKVKRFLGSDFFFNIQHNFCVAKFILWPFFLKHWCLFAVKLLKNIIIIFFFLHQASVNRVRVLVDAEYTYMNPALSLVTMAMMKKFNQDGAWVWNTYQCYLKVSAVLILKQQVK